MIKIIKQYTHKIRNVSYYLIASLISVLVGIGVNPFLAIGLSHEDYAIIGYYSSFILILLPITSFSLNSYYARNYFLSDEIKRRKIYDTLMSMFIVFGAISFLIFFLIYYIYHVKVVNSIPFSPYAILSFLPIYFSSFYNIYLLKIRMEEKAKMYAFITIANSVLGAALSVMLVYVLNYGSVGRLASLLFVAVVFGCYAINIRNFKFLLDKVIIKDALYFCWPIAVTSILTFFFMGIDKTFLVQLNDNYTLGLYNVGFQISGYIGIFGTVLLQTFEPDLFRFTSLNQHRKVFYFVFFITLATVIPNVVFILFSKPLINILTYGKYNDAVGFANILCLKNVSTSFAFSMSTVLVGYGFSKHELVIKLIGALFSLLVFKFLIEDFGFYGAAWGQSISWVLIGFISAVFLYFLKRKTNFNI